MEREEVLTLLQEEIKEATKRIYEKIMEEERRLYLEVSLPDEMGIMIGARSPRLEVELRVHSTRWWF